MYLLLVAMPIAFGLSDYFGGRLSTRINPWAIVGVTSAISAVGALAWALIQGSLEVNQAAIAWGTLTGLLMIWAYALFYKALSIGKGGVIGAIVTLSVIVPMIADAVQGDLPSAWGVLGILAIVAGVAVISLPEGQGRTSRSAVMLAIGAAVVFGVQYLTLNEGSIANNDVTVLTQFIIGALAVCCMGLVVRSTGNLARRDMPALTGIGVLFAVGMLMFSASMSVINVAIASAFVNTEPIVLAACGYVFLKEKLSSVQTAALALVIAGATVAVLYG